MSFLSGGFFGGGTSENKQTTNTTYDTTTTTEIHDIGLTGVNAENITNTLAAAAVGITDSGIRGVETLVGGVGDSYQQLIGGAGHFFDNAGSVLEKEVASATTVAGGLTDAAQHASDSTYALTKDTISALVGQVNNVAGNVLQTAQNAIARAMPNATQDTSPVLIAIVAGAVLVGVVAFWRRR